MSTNWLADIHEMHAHFGTPAAVEKMDADKLLSYYNFRLNCLREELEELECASVAEEAVDALIDLMVFALGTLDAFKIDGQEAWERVLKANMSKNVGIKAARPNPLGLPDLIKPPGWQAPTHADNVGLLGPLFGSGEVDDGEPIGFVVD